MKIQSRVSQESHILRRLQRWVNSATDGLELPADNLPEVIDQLEVILAEQLKQNRELELKVTWLNTSLEKANERIEELEDLANESIEYDEDLDHATSDFMQSVISAGIADTSFDGEIVFNSDVVLSSADLKPYVREAIETWVRLKFTL